MVLALNHWSTTTSPRLVHFLTHSVPFPHHTITKVWRMCQQISTQHEHKAEHYTGQMDFQHIYLFNKAQQFLCLISLLLTYCMFIAATLISMTTSNKRLTTGFIKELLVFRRWKKRLWEGNFRFRLFFNLEFFFLAGVLLVVQVFWPWGPQNPFSILNKISKIHSHQS